MTQNRGKQFEDRVKEAFERVPRVSIDRFHDQTTGYLGSSNICDFVVYRQPYEFYFECKSVHGNTLSISSIPKPDKNGALHGYHGMITDTQWDGLYQKTFIPGVYAGVICWWIDKDVTLFIPIQVLTVLYGLGYKSVRYDILETTSPVDNEWLDDIIVVKGVKKRVFFDYDMEDLLEFITL